MDDDTSAIEDAIVEANSNGGTIFFPPGAYKVTSTIDLSSYTILDFEGGHRGPIDLIQFQRAPVVVIDGRSMSSGACFLADTGGSTANFTFKNIIFRGKDQGFELKNAGIMTAINCGFTCTTTTADSAGLFIENSFWLVFEKCAMHSASQTKPSVILRGDDPSPNIDSAAATFKDCTFASGGF